MKPLNRISTQFVSSVLIALLLAATASADWLLTTSPPDVDKAEHNDVGNPTCWVAAAANMLAAAGYGDGNNVQERADDIYYDMRHDAQIYNGGRGWADTGMRKWLQSDYNTWKRTNPYKYVHLYGEPDCKNQRDPWQNPDLPKFIGNELRRERPLRLSIYTPGYIAHAITGWGDNADANFLTENPTRAKVSDSDYSDSTQDLQTYNYDDYNNPNPAGYDYGDGWYINYNYENTHPYIDNIVTLSNMPNFVDLSQGAPIAVTRTAKGSYLIQQNRIGFNATDLHYKVTADKRTYGYRTEIDWDTANTPTIAENNNPPTELTVDWDLSDNPVPDTNSVTITTELHVPCAPMQGVLVSYSNVHFTYPDSGSLRPEFAWAMNTILEGPNDSNATAGCVVGAFELFQDVGGSPGPIIAAYRFIYEYDHCENPEHHEFAFQCPPQTDYWVGFFRFGHSYAALDDQALWQFDNWLFDEPTLFPMWQTIPPISVDLSGHGLLPYPAAQDYEFPPPEKCGDPGTSYPSGDINKDCKVNFHDFAYFSATWLNCTDPNQDNCL